MAEQSKIQIIAPELANQRLDAVVRSLFNVSWGKARDRIERGKVFVDGEAVVDPSVKVRAGSKVAFDPAASRLRKEDEIDPDAIVYVDPHVVVVNKPPGLLSVPFDDGERGALNQLLRKYLSKKHKGPSKRRGALPSLLVVHRIDKGTSGLLVFARTMFARQRLADQFKRHTVTRRYIALAHGQVYPGTLSSHLLADRGDGIRGSVERSPNPKVRKTGSGKIAVTHIEVIERFAKATLISCRLETGRTNQIRIHLAEIGHPILGERVYMRGFAGPEIEVPRLMLHAAELGFLHPVTGRILMFEEPVPGDMQGMIERLKREEGRG